MFSISTLLNDLTLRDITPPSLLNDSNINAIIHSLDTELQEITGDIKNVLLYSRIDELDEQTLNLLAWQLHVDDLDLTLGVYDATVDMKREAVKNAIKLHMKKGTQWAITEALRQLEVEAEFIPWWQDNSEPYTFKVNAEIIGDFYMTQRRDKIVTSIVRAINSNKSPRSLLTEINITLNDKIDMTHFIAVFPFFGGLQVINTQYPDLTERYSTIADCFLMINGQVKINEQYDDLIEKLSPVTDCIMLTNGQVQINGQYDNLLYMSSVKHEVIMSQYFYFVIGAENVV